MTSVDTNILIALMSNDPASNMPAESLLQRVGVTDTICICGAVFSELMGLPGREEMRLRQLLDGMEINVEWGMSEADWIAAGFAYQGYVARRRASGGGLPRRMATDFLIGAHASVRNYTLLTTDKRLYNAAFPALRMKSL